MSQYIVLSHISIQNANSIAGLTWGFPAITQFLGFTHALNRKLSDNFEGSYPLELEGCALISHEINNKVYKPKPYSDFEFLQSKNPPVLAIHKSAPPPIIEEGQMNLTISLVIKIKNPLNLVTEQVKNIEKEILDTCYQMRLAGGSILKIEQVKLLSASTEQQQRVQLRQIKRLVMPGFVLLDKSHYLEEHYKELQSKSLDKNSNQTKPQLLDAWLDFSALKYQAVPQLKGKKTQPDENTFADWKPIPKPKSGYLVPIMTGYKAISDVYDEGVVLNTRNEETKSCFVEAVHSVGKWESAHRINKIDNIIWRYWHDGEWYLCQQNKEEQETSDSDKTGLDTDQTSTMNEVLNNYF